MNDQLNLDHDDARALHRIVRAMHDGECPKCHSVNQADVMRAVDTKPRGVHDDLVPIKVWSGWRCPSCHFQIGDDEAAEVFRIFAPFMERNLAVFEEWRAKRNGAAEPAPVKANCAKCGGSLKTLRHGDVSEAKCESCGYVRACWRDTPAVAVGEGTCKQSLQVGELLPCPFCGQPGPEVVTNLSELWVECRRCKCRGPQCGTKSFSIESWNRRTAERELAELKQAMENGGNPPAHHPFFELCETIGNVPSYSSNIQDYLDAAKAEVATLRQQVESLKAELADIRNRYSDNLKFIDTLVSEKAVAWKRIKELEGQLATVTAEQRQDDEDGSALMSRLSTILTNTANALKGQPKELCSHSWHDLAEVAQQLRSENEQLKQKGGV